MKYALLIGINKYLSKRVRNLHGCVNDVNRFKEYLERRFGTDIQIKTLLNQDATRLQIIESFQSHLLQAEEGETVLFYFSGHGSQERSDPIFQSGQENEFNETLVCTDSHTKGKYDLADKELKHLISLAANKGVTVVVIIDSCHAGSATREADDLLFPTVRYTSSQDEVRPAHSLIAGAKDQLTNPKHVLLAACRRFEKAREIRIPFGDRLRTHGIFTHTLLDTLENKNSNISYRDLIFSCESLIRTKVDGQTPILEPFEDFDTFQPFLSQHRTFYPKKSYSLVYSDDQWTLNIGLIHGLDCNFESSITFDLYADRALTQYLGTTKVDYVKLESCNVTDDLPYLNKAKLYHAVPLHLPLQSVYINLNYKGEYPKEFWITENSPDQHHLLKPIFDNALRLVQQTTRSDYELKVTPNTYELLFQDSQASIIGNEIPRFSASGHERFEKALALVLNHIVRWEQFFKLTAQNSKSQRLSKKNSFSLIEYKDYDTPFIHNRQDITIDILSDEEIPYALSFQNQSNQSLFVHLFYLDQQFGIYQIEAMKVDPTIERKILLQDVLYLPSLFEAPYLHQTTEVFKIIVTQDRLKYFNPTQSSIMDLYENLRTHFFDSNKVDPNRDMGRNRKNYTQWYSQFLFVKVLRQLGTIGQKDWRLPNGKITIKGHQSFRAGVSLISTAKVHKGHKTDSIIFNTLKKNGYQIVDFSDVHQLETVLELHHIKNEKSLFESPLIINFHFPFPYGEYILAVTLPGNFHQDESIDFFEVVGSMNRKSTKDFQLILDAIPFIPHDGRSIPNQSLQLSLVWLTNKQYQSIKKAGYLFVKSLSNHQL